MNNTKHIIIQAQSQKYEQLGYFSNAKKDYKIAKKCNYQDAATALENLKAKRKRR